MILLIQLQSLWLRRLLDRADVEVTVPSCWSPFSRNSLQLAAFEGEGLILNLIISPCEMFVCEGLFTNHAISVSNHSTAVIISDHSNWSPKRVWDLPTNGIMFKYELDDVVFERPLSSMSEDTVVMLITVTSYQYLSYEDTNHGPRCRVSWN